MYSDFTGADASRAFVSGHRYESVNIANLSIEPSQESTRISVRAHCWLMLEVINNPESQNCRLSQQWQHHKEASLTIKNQPACRSGRDDCDEPRPLRLSWWWQWWQCRCFIVHHNLGFNKLTQQLNNRCRLKCMMKDQLMIRTLYETSVQPVHDDVGRFRVK